MNCLSNLFEGEEAEQEEEEGEGPYIRAPSPIGIPDWMEYS